MHEAKIKTWILSGDALETTVQVGRLANIILPDQELLVFKAKNL